MHLHRYLRITPDLAVCVLVTISFAHHIGDGAYHKTWIRLNSRNCQEFWRLAFLHVNNYINPSRLRFHHSRYLSVNMQLFLASPLKIYPAYEFGWKFIWNIPLMISYRFGFMAFPRLTGAGFGHYNESFILKRLTNNWIYSRLHLFQNTR